MIANHIAPSMSELDLQIARSVPPGGNWKAIPESVPSQRLRQIRESYARGEGSRSTYYGRLRPDKPAYTISTYFTRPGNGCHLHYDFKQHRTLSYREAARLQSFPDSFVFEGRNGSVATQIGNAVPPLLAYALAGAFSGKPGYVVDLFAGAGGLSLGFHWAGWKGIAATDIDVSALATFERNIHPHTILGDIRDENIRRQIVSLVRSRRGHRTPLVVLGGPPCQGFSTAGNKRSRHDERNLLFRDYCALVKLIDPDAFLFENVTGLTNMEGGAVYREILRALHSCCDQLLTTQVSAEDFGVPQRRRRIVIIGLRKKLKFTVPLGRARDDYPVSAQDALSDLPRLCAGQDGTGLEYRSRPATYYQKFIRGANRAAEFCLGFFSNR